MDVRKWYDPVCPRAYMETVFVMATRTGVFALIPWVLVALILPQHPLDRTPRFHEFELR